MANLPHEIMVEILSRIPVKSLCRFRCVSKTWCSLISNPHFAILHLNKNQNEKPILISGSLYTLEFEESSSENWALAVEIDVPNLGSNEWPSILGPSILGSCNGLLLVGNEVEDTLLLLNPSTREYKELPQSPFMRKVSLNYGCCDSMYGLGYDSCIDDYKIIIIFSEHKSTEIIVNVYSLKTDSWRKIEDYPYNHRFGICSPGALVNGALHWAACNRGVDHGDTIVSFDLVNETFQDVPLPRFVQHYISQSMGVLGGCLCILVSINGLECDVYVMKEYGVKESWTNFSIAVTYFSLAPVCFPKSGEVVQEKDNCLIFYNPKEETSREVVVRGILGFLPGPVYVESLVSPSYNNGIDSVETSKVIFAAQEAGISNAVG